MCECAHYYYNTKNNTLSTTLLPPSFHTYISTYVLYNTYIILYMYIVLYTVNVVYYILCFVVVVAIQRRRLVRGPHCEPAAVCVYLFFYVFFRSFFIILYSGDPSHRYRSELVPRRVARRPFVPIVVSLLRPTTR